jgi:hypothetical protein
MEFRLVLSIIDRSPVSKICTGVRSGTIIFFTGLQLSLLSTCIIKKKFRPKDYMYMYVFNHANLVKSVFLTR